MLLSSLLLLLTGFVSLPLQVDKSSSLEAEAAAKEVLEERVLHNGDSIICFDIDPHGARAKGHPSDPDYAVYGHKSVYFDLHGSSIEPYNRLVFDITPDCPGLHKILSLPSGIIKGGEPGAKLRKKSVDCSNSGL